MLFWIVVILLVVGIVCLNVGINSYDLDWLELIGIVMTAACVVTVTIMLCIIFANHTTADSMVALNTERHKALTYKLESGACGDEFGLLSKSVIDEIQDWNEDVVSYKAIQDSFWVGIFYPNVFDQFETIDYNEYNTGKAVGD